MGVLLAFLSRYAPIALFLLLQAISLSLLFSTNKYQSEVATSWRGSVFNSIRQKRSDAVEYVGLRSQNNILLAENARLRAKLPESKVIDTTSSRIKKDSTGRQRYTYVPCRILSNNVNGRNNVMVIDVGKNHGVGPFQAVITDLGIVGLTRKVTSHYTLVTSVLHKDFTLSVRIPEVDKIGSLTWDGNDPHIALLSGIPGVTRLRVGQQVVSSPYSQGFPEGTLVGSIEKFEVKSGESFFTIYVRLAQDLTNVRYAYAVTSVDKSELDSLKSTLVP